ncbi:MAG: dihydroorotase [Clostridia bacterium]|nr:dihydroorotase [Clostridia bacterium]
MNFFFQDATIFRGGVLRKGNVSVRDGKLGFGGSPAEGDRVISCEGLFVFPGFSDVHVHLREPGFSYKETMSAGTRACAHGGYTCVLAMPNLNPMPDCREGLDAELAVIAKDAVVKVLPYGAVTRGEKGQTLADLEAMAPDVCGFSDDGKGVQSEEMMRAAMKECARLGKVLAAHCEDESLLKGGYIHDGTYAKEHGHRGICSESEWGPIRRDIELVKETGCSYHVCHVSCKESVQLIREAKANGVDITCETAPHYLVMNDAMLREDGRFKMNPPVRDESDRLALIEGVLDGTIDMIATDHAPHSVEEKSRGLEKSAMGIVGIETAFPVLYTDLVKPGILPLETVLSLLTDKPNARFGLDNPFEEGKPANLTLFDLNAEEVVDPERFLSLGRNTPFFGKTVAGKCLLTIADGKVAYLDESMEENE